MSKESALNVFALALAALAISAFVVRNVDARAPVSLLNVSDDPTRDYYLV